MSAMYFLDQDLYRRENNIDSKIRDYSNDNYISKTAQLGTYELTANVNQVLTNKNAIYLVMVQSTEQDAILTMSVDATQLEFRHFMSTIVSGTSLSIESNINNTVEITFVEIES